MVRTIKFGSIYDRMTQLRNGNWVMHTYRQVILDGSLVGSAEFHLYLRNESFGIITVTRPVPIQSHETLTHINNNNHDGAPPLDELSLVQFEQQE